MAGFIGNKPGAKYATLTRQTFSTPTGTSHTLSHTVTNSDDLLLYINNVKQNPADYTASGTTLTTASLAGGTEMYCLYYGKTTETVAVPSDSVDGSHIVDDAIDSEHYATGSIDEAHLADNAVTLAKMAGGTDGQIITYDASGDPVAVGPGTDGQVLTSTGAGSPPAFEAVSSGPTSGTAQATTSAGSKTFSSIPSGTTNIIISFNEVSAATGYSIDVQLGDAGGVESSGYVSSGYTLTASATTAGNSTSGFMVRLGDAAYILSGQMVLTLLDASANTWISSHFGKTDTTAIVGGGGSKSLSAELTQLYILLGSGSYDAGSINIMYW